VEVVGVDVVVLPEEHPAGRYREQGVTLSGSRFDRTSSVDGVTEIAGAGEALAGC
jgi:hypothetical protein